MIKTTFLFVLFSILIIFSLLSWIQSLSSLPLNFMQKAVGQDIPALEPLVSTRNHFDLMNGFQYSGINTSAYDPYQIPGMQVGDCPHRDIAIYVHGMLTDSERRSWNLIENSDEIFDRVRMSLHLNNYSIPIIGYSWDSDTQLSDYGYAIGKIIANKNGPKLADFILDFKNKCPNTDVRLLAHSMGSRVVLSTLENLNNSTEWNDKKFKITSIHVLGAAVDDEEISINPDDINNDWTNKLNVNWHDSFNLKKAYGKAIENQVINFTNLFDVEDELLQDKYRYYPSLEYDSALGLNGNQKNITLPTNYNEIDVTDQILNIRDADGDGDCDLLQIENSNLNCAIKKIGDNHLGYIGFRDSKNSSTLLDDGAMYVVVQNWSSK